MLSILCQFLYVSIVLFQLLLISTIYTVYLTFPELILFSCLLHFHLIPSTVTLEKHCHSINYTKKLFRYNKQEKYALAWTCYCVCLSGGKSQRLEGEFLTVTSQTIQFTTILKSQAGKSGTDLVLSQNTNSHKMNWKSEFIMWTIWSH